MPGFVFFVRPVGEELTSTKKLKNIVVAARARAKTRDKTRGRMIKTMAASIREARAIEAQMEKIATRQRERAETIVHLKMLAAARAETAAPFRRRQALHDKLMSGIDKIFDDESPY